MPSHPSTISARRIPQTFECKPTPVATPKSALPDELMIDWGGVPKGATASIYLPAGSSSQIVATAAKLYGAQRLTAIDSHTIALDATTVSYVPIPAGSNGNLAGLLTLEVPPGRTLGHRYNVIVRQIRNIAQPDIDRLSLLRPGRKVVGGFQMAVNIESAQQLLTPTERSLAFYRWILSRLSKENRWYPVIERYVTEIALRVNGLGGDANAIVASSIGALPGDPQRPGKWTGSEDGTYSPDHYESCGKIEELIFDRFGDFEGFRLETETGSRVAFHSRKRDLAEVVRWAWQTQLRVTVIAWKREPHVPSRILLHAPSSPLRAGWLRRE
jgi:hypothetical protein